MIKIKQQVADADDICEKVLADVFGEDCVFSISVSENPEKLGYFLKGE